jgi:glyoxylase I family protein
MQPLAVHHVSITVTDVGAAFAFYTDVLGLVERDDRPDFGFGGHWLEAGGQQLHLVEGRPPEDRGQHFALQVADLDATVVELRGRGVTITDPSPAGPTRQSFVHDPEGNLVEILESSAGPPR